MKPYVPPARLPSAHIYFANGRLAEAFGLSEPTEPASRSNWLSRLRQLNRSNRSSREPVEPGEPTEPTDQTEPGELAKSNEPAGPGEPTERFTHCELELAVSTGCGVYLMRLTPGRHIV